MTQDKLSRELPVLRKEIRSLQLELEQLRPMKAELARIRASVADLFYFGLSKPKEK
jgi:prefoldin subunit 5